MQNLPVPARSQAGVARGMRAPGRRLSSFGCLPLSYPVTLPSGRSSTAFESASTHPRRRRRAPCRTSGSSRTAGSPPGALAFVRVRGLRRIQACNPPDTYFSSARRSSCSASASSSTSTICVRGLRVTVPRRLEPSSCGASRSGTRHLRGRRPCDRNERVISWTAIDRGDVPSRARHDCSARARIWLGSGGDRPIPEWRLGRRHLCAYLGAMGPQDGVDLALRAVAAIQRGRPSTMSSSSSWGGDSFDRPAALAD